jgi:hypothetical protein
MVPSGRPGAQGWSASSLIADSFTIPVIGGTVDVEFDNIAWLTVGAVIFIGGMYGRVVSISGTTVTLMRLGMGEAGAGVTDGSNAAPGMIGEINHEHFVNTSPGAGPVAIGNFTLQPGDWDVTGRVWIYSTGAGLTSFTVGISDTPAHTTANYFSSSGSVGLGGAAGNLISPLPVAQINISAPLTLYANFWGVWAGGTTAATVEFFISARRVR